MSGGGFYDKIGNWYEQDYVCLLWLRMLLGRITAVTWEPSGEDERGVDGIYESSDRGVTAFQCKSKTGKSLRPSDIARWGVLDHVKHHLERDRIDEFQLVTTTSAPALQALHGWSLGDARRETLDEDGTWLAKKAGIDPDDPAQLTRLASLARRVKVVVEDLVALNRQIRDFAAALAGESGDALVSELIALRSEDVLQRRLRADALLGRISSRIIWRPPIDPFRPDEQLERLRREFVEQAHGRRRMSRIERPEDEELRANILSASGARTILVHGGAGSGKSEVLAHVIEDWPVERGVVLPILAQDPRGVDEAFLTQLAFSVGEERLTLAIDQVDDVLQSSATAQQRLRDLVRLIRRARELGCSVLVGCRTIDARHETGLHQLLYNQGVLEEVEVGDLPESLVTRELSRLGITWSSLGKDVRRLVRVPVCLGLLQDLTEADGWQGSRTLHQLIARWWQVVAREDPAKERALNALIERMDEGCLAVDRLRLQPHEEAVAALVVARVFLEDARGWVQPVHRVLVDMQVARSLGDCEGLAALLELLGPREKQGVHQARSLRHAVTILANRGSMGATILDEAWKTEQVRTLLRRALLLGLTGERDPGPEIVRVVHGWLDDEDHSELVSRTLLTGNVGWVDACRNWIESARYGASEEREALLLGILASVSARLGDLVAEVLQGWMREDPEVLNRARWVFWQDPSEDSEALFALRRSASGPFALPHFRWEKLFRSNPARAAVLLGDVLRQRDDPLWIRSKSETSRLPRTVEFPAEALVESRRFWAETLDWWLALQLGDLAQVDMGWKNVPSSPLVDLVEILARCLGHLMDGDAISWEELVEQLPSPLRDADGWLLLEVGSRLASDSRAPADAALAWLQRESRFVDIRVGWHDEKYRLLESFIENLGESLSDRSYESLEKWILDYRDVWSAGDERTRLGHASETGVLRPNSAGYFAYRMLQRLPARRITLSAKSRLDQGRRKFDPDEGVRHGRSSVSGGWVRSVVPPSVMLQWTPDEWIERIRRAPDSSNTWKEGTKGTVEVYDREVLISRLEHLAREHPRKFLTVAEAVAKTDPPLYPRVYSSVLSALGLPCQGADERARGLDDETLDQLASKPAFLLNEACARDLGRIVESRAKHEWSVGVVERLITIATREAVLDDPEGLGPDDTASVAVEGLASLARHHPHLRNRLLSVAEALADLDPLARRAAAGVLAMQCREADEDRSRAALLRACQMPGVAASHACTHALLQVLRLDGTPEVSKYEILETFASLVRASDPTIAEHGGSVAYMLCSTGHLEPDELLVLLESSAAARKGTAELVAQDLDEGVRKPWIFDLSIKLANDAHADVGDAIVLFIGAPFNRTALLSAEFVGRLLETEAGRRNVGGLLRALDEEAYLVPAASQVLLIADHVASANPGNTGASSWSRTEEARELAGLLARLVEECEREGDIHLRERVLDAWDRLLEARPESGGILIEKLTA